jgi:glycine cleavage system H protein
LPFFFKLLQSSEVVNTDPYGKGWFMKIKVSDKNWKNELMTPEDYEKFVQE